MSAPLNECWGWKSWVESANNSELGFPLQSLPFCALAVADGSTHLGIGIGDSVLDLHGATERGLLESLPQAVRAACTAPVLNALMNAGPGALDSLRQTLMLLLKDDADPKVRGEVSALLRPMDRAVFRRAVQIGDYTDFYASIHHATNVGRLFRPDQPLLPNYKYVPIGYHGRASSIVVGGTPVQRPKGQIKPPSATEPTFTATKQLDYELEVGAYIGTANALGSPVPIAEADEHIFGFCLLNDWSARDIQAWEYQPLGPFLGKSFATSVSPWVIPRAALEPFRASLEARAAGDPEPLPYLRSPRPEADAISLQLKVSLTTVTMRERNMPPLRLSSANTRALYWSFAQMVAHHSSNGCNLLPGDLLASGTVSGSSPDALGCLLEMTQRGANPIHLPSGETRSFLEDGDEVILSGFCRREGFPSVSFGECRGKVVAASA